MPAPIPFLTEGLRIYRRGIVTQATATIQRTDNGPGAATKAGRLVIPLTFPAQIPLEAGWYLQHASTTTGLLVTQNTRTALFHEPRYQNSIILNTFNHYNPSLFESIAGAFAGLQTDGLQLPGGSPHLMYYRPLEAPLEKYLLLYQNNFAPDERANEKPGYTNLFALVQVELDEERFLFLVRQALDLAYEARGQR